MKHVPVISSNLLSVAYDEQTQILEVLFKGKNGNPVGLYQYAEVPASVHAEMMDPATKSKGEFFDKRIKKVYVFLKVS